MSEEVGIELPLVGKEYWHRGYIELGKSGRVFRRRVKPYLVKVIKVERGGVWCDNYYNYLTNVSNWKNILFETEDEAKQAFNDMIDEVIDRTREDFEQRVCKLKGAKLSV